MNIPQWSYTHRRSLLFLVVILGLAGLTSVFSLPVSLFPNVSFPRVRVDISAGDRPASQMAVAVTRPIAEAIRVVRGVRNVKSITSRGSAQVVVDFDWGANMSRAYLSVNAAMSQVLPQLPPGTTIHAIRMDPTIDEPVVAYSLRSKTLTQTQLYDIAQYQLRPLLSGVKGVALVDVQGQGTEELHIDVDPAKLRAQNLTMADVVHAVSSAADITALGHLADHYRLFLVLANNQPASLKALSNVVIRAGPGGVVRIGDIATVEQSIKPEWVRTFANGRPAILIQVFQQPSANSLAMVNAVKAKLAAFAPQLPKGVQIANWYDQTELVRLSAGSVRDAILIGIGLAALVLFAFLRNTRVILIAMLVVPGTLAITTLLLKILGMSFNMMTLGGMAAAVGLLIDDVVVMTEHIMRRLRDSGSEEQPRTVGERIIGAAREFAHPQTGSSLATIVIFLPLAFLTGVTGAFFKALSLTMASALVISYFLTFFVVPLLAERFIDERHAKERPPTRLWQAVARYYHGILQRLIARPALLLIVLIPLVVGGYFAFKSVGSGFLPKMDQGGFTLDYLSQPGTSLKETNRLLLKVAAILRADPYVSTWSRRTGLQLGGGLTEANRGDIFVRLKSGNRPPTSVVMEHIREEVVAKVPGLDVDVSQLLEDMIGDLTSAPQPIVVKLFSDNVGELDATAKKVAAQLLKVRGVASTRDGINPAGDALEVHVDPVKAAMLGLDPKSVANQVAAAVAGTVAAELPQGPKMVGVRVWVPPGGRAQIQQLEALPISDGHGHVFPLSRLATITPQHGQPEIDHENLKRMVAVTGRIAGRDLGSTMRDVQKVLAARGELPTGMYYELGGLYQQQQIAFHGMTIVLIAAIALVFTLLLFLYESFRTAIVILIQPLLAMCGVFIGLWVTGTELDISSMMGMTMIVGIVTELAIFYFSEFADLERATTRAGQPFRVREALLEAGHGRMRAIFMSAIAMVLTLLPLALALGRGAQMQQPLAIAIIAGMLTGAPLVLVVMPVLYSLTTRRQGA
ncbi:MAG: efflux RND transporter permease subunit [Rhodanobacteraceae bacterium]|nr:MAG: efflux RND transporter permease subunit [Rhodanobacteraceae bacterium]